MAPAEFTTALDRTNEIELGTIGRATGRPRSQPVWFVRHDDTLYLLPVTGSASNWYRNVLHTPRIHLAAGDAKLDTTGNPITDPDRVRRVVEDFAAKYGADNVAAYYPDPDVAVEASLT